MEEIVRQRFKALLATRGLTINKVATLCNIPQSNVQKQLNGDTSISLKTIMAILNGIPDLSAEWLLRGNGDMFQSFEATTQKTQNKSLVERIADLLPTCGDEDFYEGQLEEKDKTIRNLIKRLNTLENTLKALNKEVDKIEYDIDRETKYRLIADDAAPDDKSKV